MRCPTVAPPPQKGIAPPPPPEETSPPEDENDARNWHSQAAYRRRSVHASLVGAILTKISTLVADELRRRGYALAVFEDDAVWVQPSQFVLRVCLEVLQGKDRPVVRS